MKLMGVTISSFFYKHIVRPILFLFDPEVIHNFVTFQGDTFGKSRVLTNLLGKLFAKENPILKHTVAGIEFKNPIGLAAGFDYEGSLTQILGPLGFGFQTVGTITKDSYEGNPPPRLGRLPKSRSLMVNKGFKNRGADKIARELKSKKFPIPLGVSIGKTNTTKIKTKKEAVSDVVQAFEIFEEAKVENAYYELNISCPNLSGNISFYPPENLRELLFELDKLKLKKPVFVKMPIGKSNESIFKMLNVIIKHRIKGVIFGNVQTNRNDPALYPEEVAKFKKGNFSGKPTQKRSDELISLAYKRYGSKLIIVGCGGVFSAQDAYRKIKLGASLIQLITGLIYEGPLLVSQINNDLPKLLKRDGFKNISDAIGVENRIQNKLSRTGRSS